MTKRNTEGESLVSTLGLHIRIHRYLLLWNACLPPHILILLFSPPDASEEHHLEPSEACTTCFARFRVTEQGESMEGIPLSLSNNVSIQLQGLSLSLSSSSFLASQRPTHANSFHVNLRSQRFTVSRSSQDGWSWAKPQGWLILIVSLGLRFTMKTHLGVSTIRAFLARLNWGGKNLP